MPSAPSGWSSRWPTYHGLAYMRTSRPKTDIIYGLDEQFPIGGSKVLRQSANGRRDRRRRRRHGVRGAARRTTS